MKAGFEFPGWRIAERLRVFVLHSLSLGRDSVLVGWCRLLECSHSTFEFGRPSAYILEPVGDRPVLRRPN